MTSDDLTTAAVQHFHRLLRLHVPHYTGVSTMTTKKMTTLGRDPYGRFDYVRRIIPAVERTSACAWCGKAAAKFQYGTHGDGLRDVPQFEPRAFCSQSCHNSHGVR